MPYKTPNIPIFPDLMGTELRVQSLQQRIAELDFIEYSFGLAKRITIERGEEVEQVPVVYVGVNADPLDMRMWPDDAMKSYAFWDIIEPAEFLYFDNINARRRFPKVEQPLALIVCMDSKQISQRQDYNVTYSVCKNEIINKLNSVNPKDGIFRVTAVTENRPVEVFDGYDVDDNLMEPRSCIRIEGVLTYTHEC